MRGDDTFSVLWRERGEAHYHTFVLKDKLNGARKFFEKEGFEIAEFLSRRRGTSFFCSNHGHVIYGQPPIQAIYIPVLLD